MLHYKRAVGRYMKGQKYNRTQSPGQDALSRTSHVRRLSQDVLARTSCPDSDVLARTFMSYCTSAPSYRYDRPVCAGSLLIDNNKEVQDLTENIQDLFIVRSKSHPVMVKIPPLHVFTSMMDQTCHFYMDTHSQIKMFTDPPSALTGYYISTCKAYIYSPNPFDLVER